MRFRTVSSRGRGFAGIFAPMAALAFVSLTLASFVLVSLALVLHGSKASGGEPITVNVVMIDDKFQPDHLILQHGLLYRLHLENHGKETHEFTAPTFFAAAKIENPDVLNRERSEIVMQPGDVKDLYLTPGPPGTYDLRCADHDWDGMIGGITVQ